MADKLSDGRFRPLQPGERGVNHSTGEVVTYSKSRRSYFDPVTKEIKTLYQFQKDAHGGKTYTQRHAEKVAAGTAKTYKSAKAPAAAPAPTKAPITRAPPPAAGPGGVLSSKALRNAAIAEKSRQTKLDNKYALSLYVEKVNKFARENNLPTITEKQARAGPEWRLIKDGLKSDDKSAHGKKAQALVLLGLRQPEWEFDVGQTPPR